MRLIKLEKIPEIFEHASVCPECGSEKFRHDSRDMYCLNCSLVIIEE